ncbi:MAG: hypothetical protein LBN95_03650 [Prevotellaceae bacterium]|jgi:hypothetical protein|nr:hypothetical protein [Prevotellaceae bacterium]
MNTDINSYRFTSDTEPTDEQLFTIMKEVESDVRRENAENILRIQENIQREYRNTQSMFQKSSLKI